MSAVAVELPPAVMSVIHEGQWEVVGEKGRAVLFEERAAGGGKFYRVQSASGQIDFAHFRDWLDATVFAARDVSDSGQVLFRRLRVEDAWLVPQ